MARKPGIARRRKRRNKPASKLPYSAQPRLITPAELRFLHTGLQPAIGNRFHISVQVPMTAVLKVDPEHWDKAAGRKIRQKKMDFVLAYPKTFRIAAVIELDDRTHELPERQKRDQFVNQAFEAAGVLLIRIAVYKKYDPTLIRSIINRELKRHRDKSTSGSRRASP